MTDKIDLFAVALNYLAVRNDIRTNKYTKMQYIQKSKLKNKVSTASIFPNGLSTYQNRKTFD